jgi:hypothetical protein
VADLEDAFTLLTLGQNDITLLIGVHATSKQQCVPIVLGCNAFGALVALTRQASGKIRLIQLFDVLEKPSPHHTTLHPILAQHNHRT